MSIWKESINLEELNAINTGNMAGFLGIEFTGFGENNMTAKMPVNERTMQPMGRLHGGASVVLAETLGSVASTLYVGNDGKKFCVGLAINANHIRAARGGYVYAKATALHLGRTTHVWQIEITGEDGRMVCSSRLTMAVVVSG